MTWVRAKKLQLVQKKKKMPDNNSFINIVVQSKFSPAFHVFSRQHIVEVRAPQAQNLSKEKKLVSIAEKRNLKELSLVNAMPTTVE